MTGRNKYGASRLLPAVALLALSAGGCGIDFEYLIPVILGQLEILAGSVPIEDAIDSGKLSGVQVAKLELILDARAFADREIALNTADNFTLFFDTGDNPTAYNVSACVKHAFAPKRWTFPIVGTVPYLGFFEWKRAAPKINELIGQGFDVSWYEVDAYSTLDYFPDPVFSAMLRRDDLSLVDTVIHELLHSTVWHRSNTTFNESLATFVGRTGAVGYFKSRHPDEPDYVEAILHSHEDTDRYNVFIADLYDELDAFYSQDVEWSALIAWREGVYQAGRDRFVAEVVDQMHQPENYAWVADLPTNNAWILANRRYNFDLDVFERVHAANGQEWGRSLGVFSAAVGASNPFAYLDDWLDENTNGASQVHAVAADSASDSGREKETVGSKADSVRRGPCARPTAAAYPF